MPSIFVNHEYKQVIVLRQDIGMSAGKKVAQGAHAAVSAADIARQKTPDNYKKWLNEGQKKVALKVNSEEELIQVYQQALSFGLPVYLIQDAGLTELEPGTKTAVGIGPAKSDLIDKITGNLKLL